MPQVALLSVYNKEGIVDFAKELIKQDFEIMASGGTARALKTAGVEVRDVAELVGGSAILGHKVVTLSRELHAGLLADPDKEKHEMAQLGLTYIDLVCVDLYPLEEELNNPDRTLNSIREKTDIGGPTILRAAAKGGRIVISTPASRAPVLEWLGNGRPDEDKFKLQLAAQAEQVVADYVALSARLLNGLI